MKASIVIFTPNLGLLRCIRHLGGFLAPGQQVLQVGGAYICEGCSALQAPKEASRPALPGQLRDLLQQVLHICSPVCSRRPVRQSEAWGFGHAAQSGM